MSMKILKKGLPVENKRIARLKMELKEEAEPKTIKFSFNLPRSLHKAFRTKCSIDDKDMVEILLAAIEEYLRK